ncbi:MAG: hypothetical protein G3I10_05470 [Ferrovum sp.]|nr:hypothetical protein [Ferrovum sp.]
MKRSQKDHWFPDEGSYPGDDNLDALDDYNAKLTKVQPSSTADLPTRLFERADALAIQHLDHTRRYSIAIFVMALLTEIVPLGSDRFEFTAYFVLLLGMYWLVRIMHPKHTGKDIRKGKKGNENKESTDFRALAEGLRIQAAWQKAGVFDAVALRHLRHDHESLAWVRRALLGSALLGSGNNDLPLSAAREAIERVRSQWVESEASWFKKRYHQRHGQGGFWRKLRGTIPALDAIAWVLFWIGLLVAALALVLSWHPLQGVPPNVDDYLGLLHGLLPAWAAMFWVYLEFAEYREDADEYRRAAQLYWIANRRIEALRENEGDFPETRVVEAQRAVLHQLGIEALHENARWAHRHKSHDASITL